MSKNETYDIGITGEAQAYQSLDRNIIYLSAGAIVVSLVILKTSLTAIIHAYLIIVAGLLFCLALIFSLWSFFSSAKGFRKIYTEAEERKITGKKVSDLCEYKITNFLNWCSIISFTVGLLTLLTFVALNIFSI